MGAATTGDGWTGGKDNYCAALEPLVLKPVGGTTSTHHYFASKRQQPNALAQPFSCERARTCVIGCRFALVSVASSFLLFYFHPPHPYLL